jgi:hypothetical protein
MDLNGFNAAEVEPQQSMEPLPAGWYKCVITDSEEKPTKAQTGSYLQMALEVIEGDHQGRKVFERLNLNNPNQTAVEIAQRTLSSICRAIGVMTPRNSADLHDKPMMVKIAVKPGEGQYGPSNDIKSYEPVEKGSSPQTQSESKSTPPWKRK